MVTIDPTKLSLTFDDEFNTLNLAPDPANGTIGAQLATNGWETAYPFGGYAIRTLGTEAEYYSDPTVGINPFSVHNGVLTIAATPVPASSNPAGKTYESGLLTTYGSFAQEYGYFEVRAELPAGDGLFPAFWMLPTSNSGQAETDVFEAHGNDTANIYSTILAKNLGINNQTETNVSNYTTGFHTYGVDWEPTTTTFYFDDVAIATVPTQPTANTPMYMLLDLAVGTSATWGGGTDTPTSTFSSGLQVDYVRAYATANTVVVAGPAAINPTPVTPPAVIGAQAGQVTIGQATISPFAGLQISDVSWAVDSVTITVSNTANGTLLANAGGYYDTDNGEYVVTGSAAAVTACIEGLVFSPTAAATAQGVTTTFTISVSSYEGTTSNMATSVVEELAAPVQTPAALPLLTTPALPSLPSPALPSLPAPAPASSPAPMASSTGPVNVTDTTGGLTFTGTAAGLNLISEASYDAVSTAAGASDTLALFATHTSVVSSGTDWIVSYAGQQTISAAGRAYITGGSGSNAYTLAGSDTLLSNGADLVAVAAGVASITASGSSISITQTGGVVKLAEAAAAGAPSVTVTGSSATIATGAGWGGVLVSTGAGGNLVQFGTGADTITSGGPDTVVGGAGNVTLTGSGITFTDGSGGGTIMGSGNVVTVTGGSGAILLAGPVSAVTVNGTQGLTVTGYYETVTGGSGLLTVNDQRGVNTIIGGSGGLNATVAIGFEHVSALGAATVSLGFSVNSVVNGGGGVLNVTDSLGGNTVSGGSGGMVAVLAGANDQVATAVGASDSITLGGTGDVVRSNGNDTITGASGTTLVATGNTTIAGAGGYNSYSLSGYDTLASAGSDTVAVSAGVSAIRATGASVRVTLTGGTVQLTEGSIASATVAGGGATISAQAYGQGETVSTLATSSNTITLGAGSDQVASAGADVITAGWGADTIAATGPAVIYGGSGPLSLTMAGYGTFVAGTGTANVTEGAAGGSVQFGSGSTTVSGGSGRDSYLFGNGGSGHDVIQNFKVGVDALSFAGFGSEAVQSQSVVNGSLTVLLTDHTSIVLQGVGQKLSI